MSVNLSSLLATSLCSSGELLAGGGIGGVTGWWQPVLLIDGPIVDEESWLADDPEVEPDGLVNIADEGGESGMTA